MAPRNKRKAARPQDPSIPKRARNHRTKQDPWEKSREDDEALEVEAILRVEYRRGLPSGRALQAPHLAWERPT